MHVNLVKKVDWKSVVRKWKYHSINVFLVNFQFHEFYFFNQNFNFTIFFVNFQFHKKNMLHYFFLSFSGIFQLIFGRLTSSKTTKFIKSFLVFLSLFTYHFGGTILQELCDAIQPNLFGMVLERLIILEVQKVIIIRNYN